MKKYWDITLPVSPQLPSWPGDPGTTLKRVKDMDAGDANNVSRIDSSVHFGTHLDAPVHFINGAGAVEDLPLEVLIGPATVAAFADDVAAITPQALDGLGLAPSVTRLLLKTRNSDLWNRPDHQFYRDYVALTPAAAEWMVQRDIRLVGIDYLSIQAFHDPDNATHLTLLGAGVIIVEGLDLRAVPAGQYEFTCLPMKLAGSDGAPVRAVLTDPAAP
jgi:arylformamidase